MPRLSRSRRSPDEEADAPALGASARWPASTRPVSISQQRRQTFSTASIALIAPLLVQPIAPDDIAEVLADVAVGTPQGRYVDVAGPETQDLVDMARRTHAVLGHSVRLVPTWSGPLGQELAGNVLLPGDGARIAPTTFEQWLAAGAR